MDAVKMRVALAPEEFRRIEGGNNEEKKEGTALHRLHHEKGDGPYVLLGDAASEITVVNAKSHDKDHKGPERYIAENVSQPETRKRNVLRKGRGAIEDLMDLRKLRGHERAYGQGFREFLFFRLGCAAALRARRKRLHRHGKKRPDRYQRQHTGAAPQEPVVEEYAIDQRGRPGQEQRVLFNDGPIASDIVEQDESHWIENARPEAFKRARGREYGDPDDVDHEQGDACR